MVKNSGKCYFSKLNLVKNKDNSYTLFGEEYSKEDGSPKKFTNLDHFNKFWILSIKMLQVLIVVKIHMIHINQS